MVKKTRSIFTGLFLFIAGIYIVPAISSGCGKQASTAAGLNIQYEILNLSPDLQPVDLFIDFNQVNPLNNPFVFGINPGYFFVPSVDTPYQIRPVLNTGTTLLHRDDMLQPGAKYSLFIAGQRADNSLVSVFTVDTSATPTIGRGKLRFVNVSPTATGGLDVYANGTKAFNSVLYTKFSNYIELPAGNYDLQVNSTGSATVLKDVPGITIQDGRLYTLYAYGYTTRADSAAFNAAVITNK